MNTLDIAHHRLYNQQIATQRFAQPAQVVAWLGAVQAQDFAGAKWSIGLRLPETTDKGIERAIIDRTIVRTWPMRGTLHFLAAEDVRWMLKLLTTRTIAGSARRQQELELDGKVFARCEKLFIQALQGGRQLSRDAIYALLEKNHISTGGQRGYHILWRLAQEGLICFGAPEGKQQTFALLDEWVPKSKSLEREVALAELAQRYFSSHGPASLHDFVGWSGLRIADAKAGLDAVASRLVQMKINDTVYWMPQELNVVNRTLSTLFLLPGFDEFMLGYKDRTAALELQHADKICPGSNGMFSPTLVWDGRVVGTWKRTFKKGTAVLQPTPFDSMTKTQTRALAPAAERYARYLGAPVILSCEEA
ncbi:winged helix DNA-binding domain-containing protein [Pedosphaera parvula]|uniref:Winged helix DNA-binding domain-containing protein n=1 Tax=Pedosphaera parvula (strain Ellin514) TaxID=320771 RepID=B9XBD4_PEDPL|nr:winged helix DNA-binding domain-containing protein [Pedosphaera parvula]EEF62819.1 conserved hypothetical protein [Pedosphaera parvula Ellin514]